MLLSLYAFAVAFSVVIVADIFAAVIVVVVVVVDDYSNVSVVV